MVQVARLACVRVDGLSSVHRMYNRRVQKSKKGIENSSSLKKALVVSFSGRPSRQKS
jgi:hypothetical protein